MPNVTNLSLVAYFKSAHLNIISHAWNVFLIILGHLIFGETQRQSYFNISICRERAVKIRLEIIQIIIRLVDRQ